MTDPFLTWLLERDAVSAAPGLLNAHLRTSGPDGDVVARITEVEAYLGPKYSDRPDPGAHAWGGKTARNGTLFGPAGYLYVYFTYGMHHCANVVSDHDGVASGLLLRAGEIVDGVELARERRRARPEAPDKDLARGPARLAQALGLNLTHNGTGIFDQTADTENDLIVRLTPPDRSVPAQDISTGPRVGVSGPGGSTEYPWRYWIDGDPTVSKYRPAVKRQRSKTSAK